MAPAVETQEQKCDQNEGGGLRARKDNHLVWTKGFLGVPEETGSVPNNIQCPWSTPKIKISECGTRKLDLRVDIKSLGFPDSDFRVPTSSLLYCYSEEPCPPGSGLLLVLVLVFEHLIIDAVYQSQPTSLKNVLRDSYRAPDAMSIYRLDQHPDLGSSSFCAR